MKVLKCQKSNISTSNAHRLDGKNRVICLVVMYTLRVIIIKMARFCMTGKKLVTIWAKYISESRRSYGVILEKV